MDVMHLSAECYPVAKAGGLGDVVGALPKYLCEAGVNAYVVMPYYDRKFVKQGQFKSIFSASVNLGSSKFHFSVLHESSKSLGFDLYLIHIKDLLDRSEIYGYPDEIEQFITFQLAVLEWINISSRKPDIIHCHDHHTGLIPFLLSNSVRYKKLTSIPTVCTVHNGQYQGWLGWDKISYLGEIDLTKAGLLDWGNCINSLAAAIKCCWKFTTVSPSYLEELRINANGLEKLFEMEKSKGQGIINGIDTEVWNPADDPFLTEKYDLNNFSSGKNGNKMGLCKKFNLSPDLPLFSFIGRLVGEKGADYLPDLIASALEAFPGKFNFILLGSGERSLENELLEVSLKYKKHFGIHIGYDEELSHLIYAASDFLIMPSRVEPCGLNQLYAIKYGTMPIVHSTGGLKDTIVDFQISNGYGIRFDELTLPEMIRSIKRALEIYDDKLTLEKYRFRMMELDFSWDRSAKEYISLYKTLIKT